MDMMDMGGYSQLIPELHQEIQSANNYFRMAEQAHNSSEYRCFIAAAVDETEHAEFLADMVEETDNEVPIDLKSQLEELRKKSKRFQKR